MSLQVGPHCFATPVEAAAAACAAYVPETSLNGEVIRYASCAGVTEEGDLLIQVAQSNISGAPLATSTVALKPAFGECMAPQLVEANLTIFAALATLFAVAYGFWKVKQWVDRGARSQE